MFTFCSIQIFDPQTGLIVCEHYGEELDNSQIEILLAIVSSEHDFASEIIDCHFLLDNKIFITDLSCWEDLSIRIVREKTDLPYRIHGGRERDLMGKGIKPLAVFSDVVNGSKTQEFINKYFDSKIFTVETFEDDAEFRSEGNDYLVAIKGEEWRIKTYEELIRASRISGWSDALEKIQGFLLGYTIDQQVYWMKRLHDLGNRWGLHAVYILLNQSQVEFVKNSGFKTLGNIENEQLSLILPFEEKSDVLEAWLAKIKDNLFIAKFYVRLFKIMRFHSADVKDHIASTQSFFVPKSELSFLNAVIDGQIEIRQN